MSTAQHRPAVRHRSPGERGHGVRALRHGAGLTAAALAAALDVRPSTVYNWEHGRSRVPEHHLPALAAAVGLHVADLRRSLREAATSAPRPAPRTGLAQLRRRAGLTRRVAAERLGVGVEVIGRWEREGPPSWYALRHLAATYGVRVEVAAHAARMPAPRALDPRSWRAGDLPQVVRTLRSWTGLTQRDLARRIGCSHQSVRAWEAARGVPGPALRSRIEQTLGLPDGALVRAYPGSR